MLSKKPKKPMKRTGFKKKKRSPKQIAKDNAWDAFSLFIRTRDSIKTTGDLYSCLCYTCDTERPRLGIGCIQAGHLLAGRTGAVLFSEDGVHGQCYGCNIGRGGHYVEYTLRMVKEYGQDKVDQLVQGSKETIKFKIWDYEDIEQRYKEKTEILTQAFQSKV